jgi:hypothetical protein
MPNEVVAKLVFSLPEHSCSEVSSPTKGGGDISEQRLRERSRSEVSPSRASKMTPLH